MNTVFNEASDGVFGEEIYDISQRSSPRRDCRGNISAKRKIMAIHAPVATLGLDYFSHIVDGCSQID